MSTKKQRDRKRAAKPKGKKLAVVPKKRTVKRKPEQQELPHMTEPTDADLPDDAA